MATIEHIRIGISDYGHMRPGDPVRITLSGPGMPEVIDVEGWVERTEYQALRSMGPPYTAAIVYYDTARHDKAMDEAVASDEPF